MQNITKRVTLLFLSGFLCGSLTEVQNQSGRAEAQSKTGLAQVSLPAISPAQFPGDQKELKLPGEIIDRIVAGGGRYLILRLKNDRQLLVFDTVKAEIAQKLTMAEDDFFLAGGVESLMVVLPKTRMIERWSMTSFKKEKEAPLPFSNPVLAVSMGCASESSLVLLTADQKQFELCQFIDPRTLELKQLKRIIMKDNNNWGRRVRRVDNKGLVQPHKFGGIQSSANGRMVLFDRGVILLTDQTVEYQTGYLMKPGKAFPGAAGNYIYDDTSVRNIFGDLVVSHSRNVLSVPAVQPGLFLTIDSGYHRLITPFQQAFLHVAQKSGFKILLEKVDVTLSSPRGISEVSLEKRFTLIPDAHLLIQIPATADKLILHKVNHPELLKAATEEYGYVSSTPVTTASPGKLYQYQLKMNSNQRVRCELLKGPKGMTISESGLITWQVPADISEVHVPVWTRLELESVVPRVELSSYFLLITVPEATGKMNPAEVDQALENDAEQLKQQIARTAAQAEELIANGTWTKKLVDEKTLHGLKGMEAMKERTRLVKESRTWTDRFGNELTAEFIEAFGGKVKLKTRTEGEYEFSLNDLSTEDQKYLRDLTATDREEKKRIKSEEQLQAAPRQQMHMIYMGMLNHLERKEGNPLPADTHSRQGQPLLSWRVSLLPFLGGEDLYELFRHDEPWDSEHNRRLIPFMPECYRSPNSKAGEGKTTLQVVTGARCLFKERGPVGLSQVTDELDQTVMLVEVPDNLAVEWTKPDDWEFASESSIKDLFDLQPAGFYALFADGLVRLISRENTLKDISRAFIRDDGEKLNLK